jgi:ethanolamine utilization cobalamin adenosyltransferase
LKFITEQYIRDLLKDKKLKEFHVSSDQILSPAAKDYLNQVRVRVCFDSPPDTSNSTKAAQKGGEGRMYVDAMTGEAYGQKPECMTHLIGNELVFKDHGRIVFRGELDHLQSQIVYTQAMLNGRYPIKLVLDIEDALDYVRGLMRAEVLNEPVGDVLLLGLDSAGLRDQSHHPDKHFGVKAMTLPHYEMGEAYALLNLLRSQSRQVEVAAVRAFRDGHEVLRQDIVQALNRLSSGFHILCCRLLSGYYSVA